MALNTVELKAAMDAYIDDLDGLVQDDKGTLEGYDGMTLDQVRTLMSDFLTNVEATN